jgi:LacI family transcriptional regulator
MKTKKRVTTQDIAQKAGVSKATVSYVLNGTGSVSASMKEKVLAIAKELGYQENRLAKATRTGKTYTLGLVVPDLCNPFFPEMAQGVVETARAHGYSVFLVDARNDPEEEALGVSRLLEYAIEGLIWCPLDEGSLSRQNLTCPVVMTERPTPGYDNVYADSYQGGKLQAQALLAFNHTTIGIISGPQRSPVAALRNRGVRDSLSDQVEVAFDIELEYGLEIPPQHAQTILNSGATCVVTANDTLAIGLLKFYHSHGIDVPNEVSIIGFDQISWSDLVVPAIATIDLPIRDIGMAAFKTLLNRIENPELELQEVKLPVAMKEKASLISAK